MMRLLPRRGGFFILLALILSPAALFAQDDATTVVGSGVVAPLVQALIDADTIEGVEVNVTGTNAGFSQLCAGSADITLATRPISANEEVNCASNGVEFLELLLGHNIVAFVTSADAETPQCLTTLDLNTALAPSAQNQIGNWNQLRPEYPDLPLAVAGPAADTPAYALADSVIEGVGLRADMDAQASDADTLAAVAATPGTLGIVSLAAAQAADNVRILEIDSGAGTGCAAPTAENVENRLYPAAERLFAYVNAASVDEPGATALFDALNANDAASATEAVGLTQATDAATSRNVDIVANQTIGRQFSQEVTEFMLPPQLVGAVTMGGSPAAVTFLQTLSDAFTGSYPSVTVERRFLGVDEGVTRLCANDIDIAVSDKQLTDDALAECEGRNIRVETIDLGHEAAVLVANASSDYLACLTTDEIATIWRAQSAEQVSTWNQINGDFPEAQMFLFAPEEGASSTTDLMMIATTGVATPLRLDVTETNNDPLYRAAATANVEGALTYMNWPEYQQVLGNNQANITLVSVDAGDGCIEPSLASITDGSYVLTRPFALLVNQMALTRPEVQGFLWTALSDANYGALQDAGFVGLEFGDLPNARAALQALFAQAAVQAASAPEATPAPEASAEATAEAPADATAEATE